MTRTLADYVPMLESIQDDPTNRLTPDYVNAIIHYKNRLVLMTVDDAGVNIELFTPDAWKFSVSRLSNQEASQFGLVDEEYKERTYQISYDKLDAHLNGSPLREHRGILWVTCPHEEPERIKEIIDEMVVKTPMVKQSTYKGLNGYAGVTPDGQPYFERDLGSLEPDEAQLVRMTNHQLDIYFPYLIAEDLQEEVEELIGDTKASIHIKDYLAQDGSRFQDFAAQMSYEKGYLHLTIPTDQMPEYQQNVIMEELEELLSNHRQQLINDFYLQSGLVKLEDFLDQVTQVENFPNHVMVQGVLDGQPAKLSLRNEDHEVVLSIEPKEGTPVEVLVYDGQKAREAEAQVSEAIGTSSYIEFGALRDLGHLKVARDLYSQYVDIALNGLENYKASEAGTKSFAKAIGLDLSDLDMLLNSYQPEQ